MHPTVAAFVAFWFAVPLFLVGFGVGSKRIGLVVLPWSGVWAAIGLFGGIIGIGSMPTLGLAAALGFWLGWIAGAGRWINEWPWGRRRPDSRALIVLVLLLAGFGVSLAWPHVPAVEPPAEPPPVSSGPDLPGGIDDRAGLLTGQSRELAEHYIGLLATRKIAYRIATRPELPAVSPVPGRRGVTLVVGLRGHAVRLLVGDELGALLTPAQCAALAASASRELASGNRVGAFWSTSESLWGILVEGRRPPGRLTGVQRDVLRSRSSRGAYGAAGIVSLFTFGLGMLFGASVSARNLFWSAVSLAFSAGSLAFFVPGWAELGLWWPLAIPVLAGLAGSWFGSGLTVRFPGLLQSDPPLGRWAWGVGFSGGRGRSGKSFGGFGGGRSGGGGASGRL